jgi:hypothetical protein
MGLGFSVHRYVLVKGVYQYNRRSGGYTRPEAHLGAGQILVWF